jgi:phosphohistidine phosphatase
MKVIVLVRHGKSSWNFDVSDRNRPLKTRGINDANLVASQFVKQNKIPEKIFSSPANRALSTCRIFSRHFNLSEKEIKIVEALYDFGGDSVIEFIRALPNDCDDIMIFGHNHAFTSSSPHGNTTQSSSIVTLTSTSVGHAPSVIEYIKV